MYRPSQPRMNANVYRNQNPYTNQWRPNYRQRTAGPLQWRNTPPKYFGTLPMESGKSEEHWCETCDRGFPTLNLLNSHKQQHQKCNIDGCQFVAHPKVITKHIQMQHSSGLYKKISKLDNPEEIQKWREERKRKYPTKANIEKKAAEVQEKIERGEKMALRNKRGEKMALRNENNRYISADPTKGVKRKPNFDKGNQRPTKMARPYLKRTDSTRVTNPLPKKAPKTLPTAEHKSKLPPFTGILNIELDEKEDDNTEVSECNHLIEDDDYEEISQKANSVKQEPVICGALTSLMCDYGSSDEESEETKENIKINNVDNISIENKKVEVNNSTVDIFLKEKVNNESINEIEPNKSDDDSGPEEMKVEKKSDSLTECPQDQSLNCKVVPVNKNIVGIHTGSETRYRQRQNYNQRHKIPSTLLQKLLSKEIRQERNIALQCIRYIIKNNYFDKVEH